MRRHRLDPFDRRSAALSGSMHIGIVLVAWLSTLYAPESMPFVTYEIELVSPPPARQAEEPVQATEELVVERPDPAPQPPEPEVEEIAPVQDPAPQPPEPEAQRQEPAPEEQPEVSDEDSEAASVVDPPEEEPEESGEGIEVRIEGLRRDYPEYYNNIIRQIFRCFRWRDGGRWETQIFFYINREGVAEDIEFVTRSGNTAFDFEAMGAVDCAGNGRFGALPEDLPYDRFPIRFSFRPQGTPMMELPSRVPTTEVMNER